MHKFTSPGHLVEFESSQLPHLLTGVLVVGSGAAGLRAAIEASRNAPVLLITKDQIKESNTERAQGGIAAAMAPDDCTEEHLKDTLRVGCGIADEQVARAVVAQGPELITELIDWGVAFDHEDNHLAMAREGGHGKARVVHARGDATGAEIEQTLIRKVQAQKNIRVMEHSFLVDLLTSDGVCLGALVWTYSRGLMLIWANAVILATGGAGQIFRETTNPPIATGDGLAVAYRAGCELGDLEFVQFHPTTLYVAGAARVLISEAVRGEGGILVNKFGEAFMARYSPMKELAPRDVVSRAILAEMQATNDTNVYLDLTHVHPARLAARFPHIKDLCSLFDIDINEQKIPVCPSAHYMVGGIMTTLDGSTSVANLFACGEAACTKFHGANRLASNSLLEALMFGRAAGRTASALAAGGQEPSPQKISTQAGKHDMGEIDLVDVKNSLRSIMWRDAGIVRTAAGLGTALERLEFWCGYVLNRQFKNPKGWRVQNMLTVADLIARSALEREESRGVHFRSDFPEPRPEWQKHSVVKRSG